MTTAEFQAPNLSDGQWERLQSLAKELSPEQAIWVGGYFTGHADALRGRTDAAPPAALPPAVPPPVEPAVPQRTLTLLYGSETGNGIELAAVIKKQAHSLGIAARDIDMADAKLALLKEAGDFIVVCSTHGEGEPPQPALDFFEQLEGRKAPRMEGSRFAVLALGDSTYEFYCEAGKRLDRRLAELGAERLAERIDCDVDQLGAGKDWAFRVLDGLAGPATFAAAPVAEPQPAAARTEYDEAHPFAAEVLENIVLTGRGSTKETRHIELSLAGSGLTYEPGDPLGIVPTNAPEVVAELAAALGFSGAEQITLDDTPTRLGEALGRAFEIIAATPRFLGHWAGISGADALRALTAADRAAERTAWLREHHIIDIVREFPVSGLAASDFVAGLRRLQPRLYSIASSQAAQDGDVHLTISAVRYELHGSERRGVVSGRLGDLAENAMLPVYVRANPHFRLPADDVPIIMIGAGTGVAPYRAFVQERELRGASGRAWLIFGERNFRCDFLYQAEWQAHQQPGGGLSLIDPVFSRDGAEKRYVQDRIRERAHEIGAWLEDGAHLYVCGDADGMAPGVHQALIDAVGLAGRLSPEAAAEKVRALQRDGRYHKDVY
jgi:sulfite reductase (NADPH) flavoprotein alpha-component